MADEWKIEDIPISRNRVETHVDQLTGEIEQITTIAERIQRQIIRTKDVQLREALQELGWIPPEGPEHTPGSKLPRGFQENWLPRNDMRFMGLDVYRLPRHDLLAIIGYAFKTMEANAEEAQRRLRNYFDMKR